MTLSVTATIAAATRCWYCVQEKLGRSGPMVCRRAGILGWDSAFSAPGARSRVQRIRLHHFFSAPYFGVLMVPVTVPEERRPQRFSGIEGIVLTILTLKQN